ncbi:hypothetical protein H5410_045736 [Solanum commersonii]|uniref:Uncharacterized protein n=1 Tax=Solanum commersonii TaxID=4109 RepID=A0A9J5XDL1_SOLCO|nr:hypothetical protein H5410_045736 [Solanum commersonii]
MRFGVGSAMSLQTYTKDCVVHGTLRHSEARVELVSHQKGHDSTIHKRIDFATLSSIGSVDSDWVYFFLGEEVRGPTISIVVIGSHPKVVLLKVMVPTMVRVHNRLLRVCILSIQILGSIIF